MDNIFMEKKMRPPRLASILATRCTGIFLMDSPRLKYSNWVVCTRPIEPSIPDIQEEEDGEEDGQAEDEEGTGDRDGASASPTATDAGDEEGKKKSKSSW